MRRATAALTVVLLCAGSSALATNDGTTLLMHATNDSFGIYEIPDPCPTPTTEVIPGPPVAVYLLVRNYDQVAGVQTAFEWAELDLHLWPLGLPGESAER